MKKLLIVCALALVIAPAAFAQEDAGRTSRIYLGPGFGLDYGGIGLKCEFEPVKYIGLFAGAGYNFSSLGWNIGASGRILPNARICPTASLLYGYNGVLVVEGASYYDATSYSVTIGGGVEWSFGESGHKLSLNLFVPIRTASFMDNYDAAKNDPRIEMKNELSPVGFSVGYNFRIF
ncbi:MAG: hypothetical protein LBS12_01170 [Prevotellaceae bacterium]|nr:hypothetical protein [Prevotellaceae bacterium]